MQAKLCVVGFESSSVEDLLQSENNRGQLEFLYMTDRHRVVIVGAPRDSICTYNSRGFERSVGFKQAWGGIQVANSSPGSQ